jgi:hypothetical protein
MAYPYYQERAPSPSEIAWDWGQAFAKEHGITVGIDLYMPDGSYQHQSFDGQALRKLGVGE